MAVGDPQSPEVADYSFVWPVLGLLLALYVLYSRVSSHPPAPPPAQHESIAEIRARQQAEMRAAPPVATVERPKEPPPPLKVVKPGDKPDYKPAFRERFSDLKSCTRKGG